MLLAKLKDFTRGGQTTTHAWRMAFQAYKAVVKFTLILSAITYVLFFLYLSDSYQRYLVKEFLINDFWISCHTKHYYQRIQIRAIDGRIGTITAGKFVNNPETLLSFFCKFLFIFNLLLGRKMGVASNKFSANRGQISINVL